MINGPKQRRYRVLWEDLGGDLYGHDRPTLRAAWAEAMSLHRSKVPWQKIRICDHRTGVTWSLNPPKGAGDSGANSE
jgi:hypothetical protein